MVLLREFYTTVARDDASCVEFLRAYGLLDSAAELCDRCGSEMIETRRKNRRGEWYTTFRCSKKLCQTFRSARANATFFSYKDINGRLRCNLTLPQILEVVIFGESCYGAVLELGEDWFQTGGRSITHVPVFMHAELMVQEQIECAKSTRIH